MIPVSRVIYSLLGNCHPKMARGMVWCIKCGRSERVDCGYCARRGWPECCGETMTIDSPEERRASAAKAVQS